MIEPHSHNSIDSPRVDFRDLSFRPLELLVHIIPGTQGATAANYGVVYQARYPVEVVEITEVHQAAGTDAGAVTLGLFKLTGTQNPDTGGVALLTGTFNLKSTADTVVTGTLTSTTADRRLVAGNRIALRDTGTLSSVGGVCVTILLKRIGQTNYA